MGRNRKGSRSSIVTPPAFVPSIIDTKEKFYALWEKGLLGNKPRTWTSREALASSGFTGTVSARTRGAGPGGKAVYRLSVLDALAASTDWLDVTFNESAPDELLLLQGEVARLSCGLYLHYDTTPGLKMREAMKVAKDAYRVVALLLLRSYLWPSSFEDLAELLDAYPEHVIEFSAHGCATGCYPHRNTLVWEVRRY